MSDEELQENESKPKKKPGRACDHVRQSLKRCLKQSDCVQKEHRQAIDCLHSRANTVPSRCFELLETFAQCKLSMIDNRLRARGKKVDLPEVETTEK